MFFVYFKSCKLQADAKKPDWKPPVLEYGQVQVPIQGGGAAEGRVHGPTNSTNANNHPVLASLVLTPPKVIEGWKMKFIREMASLFWGDMLIFRRG